MKEVNHSDLNLSPFEWFNLLHQGDQQGYVELRALPSGDRKFLEYPNSVGGPDDHIPQRWNGQNVYFGVALRSSEAAEQSKGGKNVCLLTHLLWADLDLKGSRYVDGDLGLESWPPDELEAAAQRMMSDALDICDASNLPPTAIVYSGHGLQIYWSRTGRGTLEETEAMNRGLAKLLEGDPQVVDLSRILRVPGSKNLKNKQRPLEVTLWHLDREAVCADAACLEIADYRSTPDPLEQGRSYKAGSDLAVSDLEQLSGKWKALAAGTNGPGRHFLALAVAGWLKSNSLPLERALSVVSHLAQSGGDDELEDRLRAVRDTYRTSAPTRGWEALKTDFGLELGGIALAETPTMTVGKLSSSPESRTPSKRKRASSEEVLYELRDTVLNLWAERLEYYRFEQKRLGWFEYGRGVYAELADEAMYQRVQMTLEEHGELLKPKQIRELLELLRVHPTVAVIEMFNPAYALNVENGILDLETQVLTQHSFEHISTAQGAVSYMPHRVSHLWTEFLLEAVPDTRDRLILQMYAGLCLTGDTSPQRALFLIGDGGTGKSTFVRVLSRLLGSLGTSSALEAIRDGSFLIGTLVGKRLCVVSEVSRSSDWMTFKRIVGEDAVTVDVKHKTAYTAKLDLKFILLGNNLPRLGEDAANISLMRRFIPIAFNVRPVESNPYLEAQLSDTEELCGVLNWALEGLKLLRAARMKFPATSGALERDILEVSNPLITYLDERCVEEGSASVRSQDLYDDYRDWCSRTGHLSISLTRFSKTDLPSALKTLEWNALKEVRRDGAHWSGLRLKSGVRTL